MKVLAGWLFLLSSISAATAAEAGGTITGIVVNQTGAPVARAKVLALKVEANPPHHFVLPFHEADADGHFSIEGLPWGTYVVSAGKDDEGYPDASFGVHADRQHPFPSVSLSPSFPTAAMTVHLPPKAGAIQSILVVDRGTGADLKSAAVTLQRVADPQCHSSMLATTRPILVPSNTDVSIRITAIGYKPWPGEDEQKDIGRLRLMPAQGIKLDVKLAPEGSKESSTALISSAPYAPGPNIATPVSTPSNPVLAKAVEHFSAPADDISGAIRKLAHESAVQIGFAGSLGRPGSAGAKSPRIDVQAGTVRDVLNAIVAADPAYTWEEAELGVVNVLPKEHAASLLNVVLGNYSITNTYRDGAIDTLLKAPEVQRWMEQAGVTPREPTNTSSPLSHGGSMIFRLTMGEKPSVRSILNCILSVSKSRYWECYREGDRNQFLVITMSD